MKTQMTQVLHRLMMHYGPQRWWDGENEVEDMLAMILIQRTTERNAQLAMANLIDVLDYEALLTLSEEDLQARIRPAGFYKQKSKTIRGVTRFLYERGGVSGLDELNTTTLRTQLLHLNGIGPETADVMLLYLFNRPVFVADEYARRLFRRLGLGDYEDYEQMRQAIQPLVADIPVAELQEWHAVIDEHGKAYRKAKDRLDESWLIKEETT